MIDQSEKHVHMVPCRVCQEPIRKGAKKCIHCSSMLDWHGWLGVSETTLALLVALVSVIGASAPRIAEVFTRHHSELSLNIRQVLQRYLELAGSNQGDKNSLFLSARITAKTSEGKSLGPLELELNGMPQVFAGQQAVFGLSIPPTRIPEFLDWPHKDVRSAAVAVTVREFGKGTEERTIEVPAGYFHLFCRATEDFDAVGRPQVNQGGDHRLTSRCM